MVTGRDVRARKTELVLNRSSPSGAHGGPSLLKTLRVHRDLCGEKFALRYGVIVTFVTFQRIAEPRYTTFGSLQPIS
jgi:hypothetical protein